MTVNSRTDLPKELQAGAEDAVRVPMRVLAVSTFFPNATHPQRAVFVKNLVQAMRQRCQVDVIAPLPYAPPFGRKGEWRALRMVPARENIDGISVEHPRFVVLPKIEWLSGPSYCLGILRAMRRWKQRLREGEQAVVHAHCAYPDAVGVVLAARLLGLRCVVTAHGSDINIYANRTGLRFQIRWALRRAAGTIAVSGGLQEKIAQLVGGGASRSRRIPCAGFYADVFYPRDRAALRRLLGIDEQARVVVFVGLLVPIKGIEFLIRAWAALAGCNRLREGDRLIVLGDGPLRKALRQEACDGSVEDSVHFAGSVTQLEVGRWVGAADALCLPSRNEGTPNVVVEALASGVPVVASRVGGIPDLVQHGTNGLLVPPADVDTLAQALAQALAAHWNPQQIARSVAHLTWRAIADQNVDFLQSAIEGKT